MYFELKMHLRAFKYAALYDVLMLFSLKHEVMVGHIGWLCLLLNSQ